MKKNVAQELIVSAVQKAFALAYRWPYCMSIAFGGACFICSWFIGDVRKWLMDDKIAVEEVTTNAAQTPQVVRECKEWAEKKKVKLKIRVVGKTHTRRGSRHRYIQGRHAASCATLGQTELC